MFFDFLKYYLTAGNAHRIHSPFIFELYTKVYRDFSMHPDFEAIEAVRKSLMHNRERIRIEDLGAGSRVNDAPERSVSDIARKSLQSPFWGQFFYRIIRYYDYRNVIELGTSLGITTAYLARATPEGTVYTAEGCENTLNVARSTFRTLGLDHVVPVQSDIGLVLEDLLNRAGTPDFVLFDANHRYEPTLAYFEACAARAGAHTVFVFDDIYWSAGMKKAWQDICQDPRVSLSVDFFHIGLVFFRQGVEKQHFVLK